jgi:hypothetical protein
LITRRAPKTLQIVAAAQAFVPQMPIRAALFFPHSSSSAGKTDLHTAAAVIDHAGVTPREFPVVSDFFKEKHHA